MVENAKSDKLLVKGKYFFLPIFSVLVLLCGCTERAIPMAAGSGINRIISAAPSNTDIIAGLGLADKLIAVDKYSRDIAGVRKDLPEIDFFYPDIEAVSGLKPDIIIAGEINTEGRSDNPYQFFEKLGITVIQIPTANSIEEIHDSIIHIAQALGVEEKGEELARTMWEQIEAIAALASAGTTAQEKSVYFEIAPAPSIVSFGRGTYLNELIEILGARNIFADERRWFVPGPEAIIYANPDVIFFLSVEGAGGAAGMFGTAEELKSRPGFHAISAVRENRVYAVDSNHAARPSQNIVLALREMYQAIYVH